MAGTWRFWVVCIVGVGCNLHPFYHPCVWCILYFQNSVPDSSSAKHPVLWVWLNTTAMMMMMTPPVPPRCGGPRDLLVVAVVWKWQAKRPWRHCERLVESFLFSRPHATVATIRPLQSVDSETWLWLLSNPAHGWDCGPRVCADLAKSHTPHPGPSSSY